MDEDVSREVDQLLKDREKFESWLKRLEQQRSQTSEQAYERVHRDYQQRLEEVIGRLQSHSDSIKGKLRELQQPVSDLDEERSSKAEELDEARLRHMVGEYGDDTDWRDLEGQLLTSLQETEGRIAGVRGEIGRLEEIVALVERTEKPPVEPEPAEPPRTPEPPPVQEAVVEAEPGPVTSTLPPEVIEVEAAEPVRVEITPEPPDVETPLEQVVSEPVVEPPPELVVEPTPEPVVDTLPEPVAEPEPFAEPPPEVEPPPPQPEPAPPPPEPLPREPVFEAPAEPEVAGVDAVASADDGYLSLGELVLEDRDLGDILSEPPPVEAAPEKPAEPAPAPQPEAEGGDAAVGDELAFLESLSLGSDDESEGFSLFEQRGSGTPQTIICPHCSAANDPAEWYCTECGEELPAE
jgi:hypothetical protein